jgi:ABC transporter DrrB family efflux protein
MPGIFAQTLAFAAGTTAVGIADDMTKGLIDRFRSLPMARSAFLTGRTVSDVVYNLGILIVLMLSGLVVGWRVREGIGHFLAGVALALLFAYAMSWVGVLLGMLVPSVEVGQQVVFTTIFPLTFLSNAFVPTETLPNLLQPIAEWNPVSVLTASMRDLWGNPNPFAPNTLPGEHPVLLTLIYVAAIIAVFAPLAVRRYRHATGR